MFDTDSLLKLAKLTYTSQSVFRILFFLGKFKVHKDLKTTKKEIEKLNIDLKDWIDKDTDLKIECEREGNHDFRSVDTASVLAGIIKKKTGHENFTFKHPDLIIYIYINNNQGYIGIDFAGKNLSKRQYKIFQSRNSIKATLAYSLIRISGFSKNKLLADVFSREGIIPIEAALFTQDYPVNFFTKHELIFTKLKPLKNVDFEDFFKNIDKNIKKTKREIYAVDALLKYVKFSKKNAKIAGVLDAISFSKKEMEWLDLKFDKTEVDCIVSYPVQMTKRRNKKEIKKLYNEFFYQCEYILKDKGKIVLLSKDSKYLEEEGKKYKFKVEKKREVYSGMMKYLVLTFVKE
ncbi:hypothetical protein GF327_07900 [Candidatus Woesearchaeota archaeon]|nr:hypothetical protein [Candidatus Woesearchaeota archaeon]